MDTELKDMLTKLLEGQTRLESEVGNIKSEVGNIKSEVGNIKSEVGNIKSDVGNVKIDVENLKTDVGDIKAKVSNNSIKLDDIEKKIQIVAEVQTAHKEQNDRGVDRIIKGQENINSLHSSSLKSISDDVVEVKNDIKKLKDKFDKVEKVTMQNTYDVAYLKSVN